MCKHLAKAKLELSVYHILIRLYQDVHLVMIYALHIGDKGMSKINNILKKDIVLSISIILAILSMFIITPDKEYIGYIDYRTLAILFSLMAVMEGFKQMGVFGRIAHALVSRCKNINSLVVILVMLCFFGSMLITNDVSLITFVPLTITVFNMLPDKVRSCWLMTVVIMQTIAVNLGSMLTPIGNPQNLYLFTLSGMSLVEFLKLMLPLSFVSLVVIIVWIAVKSFIADKKFRFDDGIDFKIDLNDKEYSRKLFVMYAVLFLVCLLTVVRLIPVQATLIAVILMIVIFDRKVLKKVDYSLLLTFTALFIFIGNVGRVGVFSDFLASIINGREMYTAIASSQIMSNVPAAILLTGFTDNIKMLILGTDVGGLGTLIASMASLISFKYIIREKDCSKGRYISLFTVYNLMFLIILILFVNVFKI